MIYPTKKLGEVCNVFADGDWVETKDQSESGIRLVQTGNVGSLSYINKSGKARYISEKTFKRLNCTEIFPGDILVSRLPDPVGRACIIPNLDIRMITAVDCTIIRPKAKAVIREYLLYFTESQFYRSQISMLLSGTTRKRISKSNLAKIQIPLPPLETQKKIVGKIEKMFAKIDEAQKLREEAKKDTSLLFQSTLNEIFSGPKAKKWEERKLKIICEIITDGTHISPDYTPTGISMLDSKNINDDFKIDDKNPSKFISLQTDRILSKKCKPKSDDVLLSSRGSIGKIAIVKKGQDFNIMGNMILLRPSDKLLAKFLANYMLFRTVEINNMAKGTSQRGLYLNQVRNFEIPVPPIVEQKKIVTRLDKLTEKVREMQKLQVETTAEMKNLKQSILDKAFKGEL